MKKITFSDGREIKYELTSKRVKNINMRIKADGVVYVSANSRVSVKCIEEILIQRKEFIFAAVQRISEREKQSEISTNRMCWLGTEYPVRVIGSSAERVSLAENELRVYTMHTEKAHQMLSEWAVTNFSQLVNELDSEVRNSLISRGLTPPETRISIKNMKSRWGSCSYTRGHISLNLRLMAYPRETVLSVLWHEYAHYWHHDHSEKFYTFLSRHYPEYHKWNSMLK